MEVLLATAILLASVLILMELASIGRYYVQSVEARSTAQMLCLTKLNELLSGAQPLQAIDERAIEDHPDWIYSVEITPVRQLPLAAVRVTVTQQYRGGHKPGRARQAQELFAGTMDRRSAYVPRARRRHGCRRVFGRDLQRIRPTDVAMIEPRPLDPASVHRPFVDG